MINTLRRWASQKHPWQIWLIPFALISPAIFIIPADVFTQYPWARGYTNFIASIVPMIDRTAHLHPQPDKFRAFYAYAWTCMPLLLPLAILEMNAREKIGLGMSGPLSARMFFSMLFLVVCVYFLYVVPGNGGIGLDLLTVPDRRVGLYRNNIGIAWFSAFTIYCICVVLICWWKYMQKIIQRIGAPLEPTP